jgi:arylsulfatase A-like enzyme
MPGPYRSSLQAAVASALGAAFLAGLVDALVAASRAEEALGFGLGARFFLGTIACYALAALVVALLEGLVAGAVRRSVPVAERAAAAAHRLREDAAADSTAAGGLLAAAVAAGIYAAGLVLFHLAVAGGMSRKLNAALSTALVALALLPLTALLWFPLWRACRLVVRIAPRGARLPRTVILTALLVLAGVLAGVFFLRSIDWRVIDFGPYIAAIGWALAQLLWLLVFYAWSRGAALRRALPGRVVLGVAVVLALVGGGVTVARFGADPRVPDLALRHGSGIKSLLRTARALRSGGAGKALQAPGGAEVDDFAPGATPPHAGGATGVPPATGPSTTPQAGVSAAKYNVLLVTIDAIRADRLGFAKYHRPITPNMDRLQQASAYFARAYAQAPNTPRSFPSVVTSQPPSRVKWQKTFANFSPITAANHTWFQDLAAAGVKNIGIFSHFYFTPERGLGQGFAEWDNAGALSLADSNTDIASPRIVPRVVKRLEALAAAKERFLLWTYLFEPHSRYVVHPEFPIKGTGLAGLEEKYDYEIAFADRWLAKILEALEWNGLDKNTIVVLFADHGEGFGEHRHYFHGQSVYEEMIHVPLIIRVPGQPARVISEPVALMDVGPTIVELLGATPSRALAGRSLAPALRGEALAPRPVPAELLPAPSWNHHARAIIDGDWKVINRVSDGLWELYNLKADPREKRNLFHVEKARAEALKAEVERLMRASPGT